MIGITVNDTTLGTTIANLGMTDVRFPKPVFHGDTLQVQTKVRRACARASRGPMPASSNSRTPPSTSAARSSRSARARR